MKKNTVLKKTAAALILACAFNVHAGIKFGEPDINEKNELLFTIRHNISGTSTYRTLFKTKIEDGISRSGVETLTCYPERLEVIQNGSVLQIRNRYGRAWYNIHDETLAWKETAAKIPENSMRLPPQSASPDGKWLCYVEKKDYASGFLVLENTATGKKITLDENAQFSYRNVPAKWANDSSVLLYEKNGAVYFCSPEALVKSVEAGEEYRKIGNGTMNSVSWSGGRHFAYIDGDIVYRINSKELYTLGLYSGIIGKGTIIGRLPHKFSPARDRFSVNPELTGLAVIQNRQNFTWYRIQGSANCDFFSVNSSRPFANNEASLLDSEILWSKTGEPAVWIKTMPFSSEKIQKSQKANASVYRLNDRFTRVIEIENSGEPSISRDGTLCAFNSGSTVYIYQTSTWKRIAELSGENIETLAWDGANNLYAGGERTTKKWNFSEKKWSVILLSQAANGYWDSGNIIADTGNGISYRYDDVKKTWTEQTVPPRHTNITRNENYRIFNGETQNKNYENALYTRSLKGKPATRPVFEESAKITAAQKRVALSFDAYDNADGIAKILDELERYKIRGTFFLNGEFIRRYPNETKQIASGRNECASMFFTTAKITGGDYIVNDEYIRRGLARNEDEFFKCTGKELSLYWHAPRYTKSERIEQIGRDAGYTYAHADCNGLDTVSLEEALLKKGEYKSPSRIIDEYMKTVKSRENTVISVSTGLSNGERDGHLYDFLDLLLSAILDEGCQIVSVRDIIK